MSSDFYTQTHGKWILAGEHAVLRGHPALVFPVLSHTLSLRYTPSTRDLQIHTESGETSSLTTLVRSVLTFGARLLNLPFDQLRGTFTLSNTIPVGVGMGASAALSVAVTRYFHHEGWIASEDLFTVAKSLENLFHGQSSGLDIAGVSTTQGIYFQAGQAKSFTPTWTPHWTLSSCNQIGATAQCIATVAALWETDPQQGALLDQHMAHSVEKAYQALTNPYTTESFQQLAQAIHQAGECFKQWGLISNTLHQHMHTLKQAGAVACKPTGSGHGGHVLSLWEKAPDEHDHALIRLNPPIDNKSLLA